MGGEEKYSFASTEIVRHEVKNVAFQECIEDEASTLKSKALFLIQLEILYHILSLFMRNHIGMSFRPFHSLTMT